jgi:hypothetical protein
MRKELLALVLLTGFASVEAVAQSAPLTTKPSAKSDQPTYIITAHTVAHDNSTNSRFDNYIIVYGSEVLKVQYAESQISTVKPGASQLEQLAPRKGDLHLHFRYGVWPQEPDVSQVPQVGVPIRACEMDTKYPDNDGHPVMAIQSVSAPCMSRNGDTLHYSLAPNGGVKIWEYVNFDILEATSSVGVAAAQSAPLRKDIPAIAKAADGAIVTIITAANDNPIAQGSGFLVSADGVIVTNYHVIKTGNVAVVKFPDDTAFPVDGVLAIDKARDLAVLKIHGKTFQMLTLGDSDDIQVGEEVVAIGNPLLLESTVSNGIISGVRTSKEQGGKFLQTTAPISPGSSGGPLFNMRGEVVGINTLYLEGGENLNFAIPVNDAKLLLSHQSAKLQNLPNEHQLIPVEEPSSTKDEGRTVRKEQTEGPYYVRARRNENYIIEYKGHQLAAHCRESLSWLDGRDKLGRPMTENECTYLGDQVGKHITEDKMLRQDNELRYRPLGGSEDSDVADVLDITDDALLGAPKRPHAAPKTSPEIQKTLHWIQNTLNDREGNTQYLGADGKIVNHSNLLTELNGCKVTFVYEVWEDKTGDREKETFHSREQVNLRDLDPASLTSDVSSPEILGGPVSTVRVHTTDKTSSANLAAGDRGWEPALVIATTDLLWELPSPYAERFVKALHHAITLCGGKASTF